MFLLAFWTNATDDARAVTFGTEAKNHSDDSPDLDHASMYHEDDRAGLSYRALHGALLPRRGSTRTTCDLFFG